SCYSSKMFDVLLLISSATAILWGNNFVHQNPRDPMFMRKVWSGVAEINKEPQVGLYHLIPVELMKVRTEV
ncbi:hypothetical protein PFISCL1PPCAC_3343, partial [Pristionchus fissidentatus]